MLFWVQPITLGLYSKGKIIPHIINVAGEWNEYEKMI